MRFTRHLLIPGPVDVAPEMRSLVAEPIEHGAEWVALYRECQDLLRRFFRTKGPIFILVGSGGAPLGAAVGTAAALGGELLVPCNGAFAERIVEIARTYTNRARSLEMPWGEPCDVDVWSACCAKSRWPPWP